MKFLKDWALIIAMFIGTVLNGPLAALASIIPLLLFAMLFVVYTKLNWSEVRLRPLHLWLVASQIVVSIGLYLLIRPFDLYVAEAVMICILASTATTAPVIAAMLGGNIGLLITYSLLSNLGIAILAPFFFSFIGIQSDMPFITSFWTIIQKVFPLLILPCIGALIIRALFPKVHNYVSQRQGITFWLWAVSLTLVMARTVNYIIMHHEGNEREIIWIGVGSLLVCLIQFIVGRRIGKAMGDTVAGGQALGQKNTILAIWLAQVFLHPLASVGPAAYVVWQNIVNSYQLWAHRKKMKNK